MVGSSARQTLLATELHSPFVHMNRLDRIEIGIPEKERSEIVDLLQSTLANQHVVYMKLRNFHWNLKGPRFSPLHELFQEHYELMEQSIDATAERIRMLGGVPAGSMAAMVERASLEEHPDELIDGDRALHALVSDREEAIRSLRTAINRISDLGDEGTADMLIAQMRSHEKIAWMLRSFL